MTNEIVKNERIEKVDEKEIIKNFDNFLINTNKNIFDLDSKNNCFGLHSNFILKTHYQENIYLLLTATYGLDILDKKEPFENFGIFDNNKKEFYSCGSLNNSDFKNSQYYKGTIKNELNNIYKTITDELEKYIKTNKKKLMENAEFLFEYDKKYSKENNVRNKIYDRLLETFQTFQTFQPFQPYQTIKEENDIKNIKHVSNLSNVSTISNVINIYKKDVIVWLQNNETMTFLAYKINGINAILEEYLKVSVPFIEKDIVHYSVNVKEEIGLNLLKLKELNQLNNKI